MRGDQWRMLARVARTPGLRRVQLAFAAFAFSEHATWLAILVFALQHGGAREVGLIAVVQLLPGIVLAPFAAFAGDRFPPQRALAFGYAAQCASMAATATAMATGHTTLAYVAAACVATCVTFTRPVMGTFLPNVTHAPKDLVAANAVAGLIEQLGVFAGPLAAGGLMAVRSPTAVFTVTAAAVGCGALLVARLDTADSHPRDGGVDAGSVVGSVFGGFSTLAREHRLRLLVLLGVSAGLVKGVGDVVFVTFADLRLHGGSGQTGVIAAAYGVGAIAGATATTRLARSNRVDRQFLAAAVSSSLAMLVLAGAADLGLALVAFAFLGAGETMLQLTSSVTIQRQAPSAVLARIFGIVEGLMMAVIAIGSLLVATFTAWWSLGRAFAVLAAVLAVTVGLGVMRLRRLGDEPPIVDGEVVDRLLADPIFALLPAPTVERLARSADWARADPAAEVITQGDAGDCYYLVDDGTAEVSIDGATIRRVGPGDSFGEIALLRGVPRTATVTARSPMRLLMVERDDFLEAVTGHPASRRLAEATVDQMEF
jgi:MFS family permease